jgi:diadenosine tetraphosphate (Ap4A) HIT family hydrolase
MNKSVCEFCDPLNLWPSELIVGSLTSSTIVLSKDQYFYGWCLVIAKEHVVDLFELNNNVRSDLEADVCIVSKAIQELFSPDIMNYAAFGNVIPHLHWNVMPRYKDDGLWGAPPWPHDPKKLPIVEAKKLAAQIRLAVGAIL